MNSIYPKDLHIKDMDARSFWELVNGEQEDQFDLLIEEKDYFQVWQHKKTGKYFYVDISEFDDFFELECVGLLEYNMAETNTKPEGRLACALECQVCGDAYPVNGKGRFMWFNEKKQVRPALVSKGFFASEIVKKMLEGIEPDETIPGTLLDNYLIIKDMVCTAYIVRPMTTQSSCYEILEGTEEDVRTVWDSLKTETDRIINRRSDGIINRR